MKEKGARILLILVFMARGTSFLFSKLLLESLPPMSIIAVRFILAFLILALIFRKRLLSCSAKSLRGGVILGLLYTVIMVLEMFGLRYIDSGVSSLLEHLAIVLVPLFMAAITRIPPEKKTLFCALLAVTGVGFLSLTQGHSQNGALGITLLLLAAVTYAVCIMATAKVSRDADPLTVGMIQLGTMGLCGLAASFAEGGPVLPGSGREWGLMLLLVLLCSCFGYTFQPLGQKHLPAEEAAVLTVVNPLTASILGITVAGESISAFKLTGYVLILSALFLYNRKGRRDPDGPPREP